MKTGELKPLMNEQKAGIKQHDLERLKLVKIIEEKYSKYPYPKRKK